MRCNQFFFLTTKFTNTYCHIMNIGCRPIDSRFMSKKFFFLELEIGAFAGDGEQGLQVHRSGDIVIHYHADYF